MPLKVSQHGKIITRKPRMQESTPNTFHPLRLYVIFFVLAVFTDQTIPTFSHHLEAMHYPHKLLIFRHFKYEKERKKQQMTIKKERKTETDPGIRTLIGQVRVVVDRGGRGSKELPLPGGGFVVIAGGTMNVKNQHHQVVTPEQG